MPHFKRLTIDQTPEAKGDINMDLVTYVEPNENYTRIHFAHEHYVDVKETPQQILNTGKLPGL